ncbi:MAG: DUF3078 domain-containing protein [Bacteroidetes bacterium]|nr:DUF3078 domain-containing protein [Bacteroidota bacterium]
MVDKYGLRRNYIFLLSIIFNIYALTLSSQNDSIKTKKHFYFPSTITYSTNFSASYIHYKNWKYNGNNNYSFLLRSNVNYDSIGSLWETHIRFNGELGYMKFVDSTWYKNSDYLDFSTEVVKNTNKKIENIFTLYFNSQFLSTYEMCYTDSGSYNKRWSSGFGSPMNIEIGYGTTIHFWKTCRMNFTFVTLRTSTTPLLEFEPFNHENDIIYKKTLITSEYGFGIQTYIRKNIGTHVRWENYSHCFANAINRSKFDIDFRNRIIIKIFRYLDFIIDSRIRYTPYPPYKYQFRNELMLSFTLEKL